MVTNYEFNVEKSIHDEDSSKSNNHGVIVSQIFVKIDEKVQEDNNQRVKRSIGIIIAIVYIITKSEFDLLDLLFTTQNVLVFSMSEAPILMKFRKQRFRL